VSCALRPTGPSAASAQTMLTGPPRDRQVEALPSLPHPASGQDRGALYLFAQWRLRSARVPHEGAVRQLPFGGPPPPLVLIGHAASLTPY
jgi:hypothetical protein